MADFTQHQATEPAVHYATTTTTRHVVGTAFEHTLACGAVHWAVVTSDPAQVTCDACAQALAVARGLIPAVSAP